MKICYLTYDINVTAGWGRYAAEIIRQARERGHEVTILKELDDGNEGEPILRRGLGIFVSAVKTWKYLRDCDVVHAFDVYPYGIIAYLANLFLKKRFILSVIGTYSIAPLYSKKTGFLSRKTLHSADTIVAISNFTKSELLKAEGKLEVKVVNPGIDFRHFYCERQTDVTAPFILSVGALKFRKGYHVSLSAFSMLLKDFPNLKYVIIGRQDDKHYFKKLKDQVQKEHLEDKVIFLENVSDEELRRYYSRAKLFVLASLNQGYHFEGFGIVFLEAAAAGLPIVATEGNGCEDSVSIDNGFLVPQNQDQSLAAAMGKILSDRELASKFGHNGYEWAKTHDISKQTEPFLNFYQAS